MTPGASWFGRARPGHPFFAGLPLLIAHRGGAGLAPENTMAAFRCAVDDWDADILELDVRLTADGQLVVLHDETVDRTTDGTGPIRAMTWAAARRLDAGHRFRDLGGEPSFRGAGVRIPLFADVLASFPAVRIIVEPKAAEAATPLVRAIRAAKAEDRVLIGAEFEATRAGAKGYLGPWGASRRQMTWFWALHRGRDRGPPVGSGRRRVPAARAVRTAARGDARADPGGPCGQHPGARVDGGRTPRT